MRSRDPYRHGIPYEMKNTWMTSRFPFSLRWDGRGRDERLHIAENTKGRKALPVRYLGPCACSSTALFRPFDSRTSYLQLTAKRTCSVRRQREPSKPKGSPVQDQTHQDIGKSNDDRRSRLKRTASLSFSSSAQYLRSVMPRSSPFLVA